MAVVESTDSTSARHLVRVHDWWSVQGALHPLTVGAATLLVAFIYLRLASNRTLAPTTIFSWIGSVALGSTISRIVTGPDLNFVQGVLSLFVIVFFEFLATFLASHLPPFSFIVISPPVLLAFRGKVDWNQCRRNRVAASGLMLMLRQRGYSRLDQVEAVVLEATGQFSIISKLKVGQVADEILLTVSGYVKRLKEWEESQGVQTKVGQIV